MPFKQIQINEKVHRKVKRIADAHHRKIAAQVEFWAEQECSHPENMRQKLFAVEAEPGDRKALPVFLCGQCKRIIS
jgi:rubrerythrin